MTTTLHRPSPSDLKSSMRAIGWATSAAGVVTGGCMFAFSTLVMPALRSLPASRAVEAMNAMNAAAPESLFLVPLCGSALGGAVVAVHALRAPGTPNRRWLVAGGTLAVLAFLVTVGYHVPHNDALAKIDPASTKVTGAWHDYYGGWVAWNHVRTLLATASGALIAVGLVRRASVTRPATDPQL